MTDSNISLDSVNAVKDSLEGIAQLSTKEVEQVISAYLKSLPEKKDFWIAYDHQVGRWLVEEKPFEVVRPGMEIIHVKEISREEVPEFSHEPVSGRNSPINFDRR